MTVPRPLAADGVVVNDPATRTLIVKPAKAGYASLLWREAHQELAAAEESGRYYATPTVWASGPQGRGIARGRPAEDGSLRFRFERGDRN